MIVVFPRSGQPIQIQNGAAVRHATLPVTAEMQERNETPAASMEVLTATGTVLAVFRRVEVAGWDVSAAGSDS